MTLSKISPMEDRVAIRRVSAEEVSKGGIVIPEVAREIPQEGEVMAVGPGKLLESGERGGMTLKEGDRVLFGKYAGTEIKVNGEEITIVAQGDVLAIVN